VYRHLKEFHKKTYRKSVLIEPSPQNNLPASISTLFQRCGVVLQRNPFLENAVANRDRSVLN